MMHDAARVVDRDTSCRICGHGRCEPLSLREVMFGTGELFDYRACTGCGTIQLAALMEDMGSYYPPDYYSFDAALPSFRERFVQRIMVGLAVRGLPHDRRRVPSWVTLIPGLSSRSRILDVGCGAGALLDRMAEWGFTSLLGVDPFIAAGLERPNGVRIRKATLDSIDGEFDLVMMHHSLEHVPDPASYLREARRLLSPDGSVLVRIPVCGGYLWQTYGTDWVQLDPPRHIHLFTERAFADLAHYCGLKIASLSHDAYSFSLWGSELVRRGLSLSSPGAPGRPGEAIFSPREMAAFERRIAELNRSGVSDNACFVLRPAS